MQKSQGKLFGIGVGPGEKELLTLKAVEMLKQATLIVVPKSKEQESTALSIVEEYFQKEVRLLHMEFPMSRDINVRIASRKRNATEIAQYLDQGEIIVFLTLGDPMLYSTYSYLLEYLDPSYNVENIPGIYSFSAMSNKIGMPLCKGKEKVSIISSFDQSAQELLVASDTTVCMKISSYKQEIKSFLENHKEYSFVMMSNVGKTNEEMHHSLEILDQKFSYFSTAIVSRKN